MTQIPLNNGFNSIEDLIPKDWVEPRDGRNVSIVAYEVQGIPASQYEQAMACDLKDVRILFFKGSLSHREDVKVTRFWIDEAGRFNVCTPEPTAIVKTPESIYSVFMSPYTDTPGSNQGELVAQRQIEVAVALITSFQGRNVAYRKMFENSYSLKTKDVTSASEPFVVPFSFPTPMLNSSGIAPMLAAERARWALPEGNRNRLDLSLRWFLQGSFSMGVDMFLKYWFAIEMLAMPSDTNIAPLNDLLAEIYGLGTSKEASAMFHTGLLFGLRGKIVHKGFMPALDGQLLQYCEYLYHDVLRHFLKLPTEKRMGHLLNNGAFDYAAVLKELLSS